MNDNHSLMARPETAVALDDPGLRDFAAKLKLLLPNGSKLSDAEALAGAQYAKVTGLDPFRGEFYVVPGIGVTPGYKGALARQGQQGREPDYRYRPLTEDERDWHDIQPGDKAVICEATDPAEAAEARGAGRAARVWVGVGIVRKAEQWVSFEWRTNQNGKSYKANLPEAQWKERVDPPRGRSWGWVAQNRAMKDCANHMGIPVQMEAADILAQAQAAGVAVEAPADAEPTADQAQLLVAEALRAHAAEIMPPDPVELQARAAANVTAMRGPKSDDPFGIDTPSHSVVNPRATAPALAQAIGIDALDAPTSGNATDPAPTKWADLAGSAERIRARLQQQAQQAGNGRAPDAVTLKKANGALGILIRDDEKRHAVRAWLFGVQSAEDLSAGQCASLLNWIDAKKQTLEDGSTVWLPAAEALADLKLILVALDLNGALAGAEVQP